MFWMGLSIGLILFVVFVWITLIFVRSKPKDDQWLKEIQNENLRLNGINCETYQKILMTLERR